MLKQTPPNREPAGSTHRLKSVWVFLAVWTLVSDLCKVFSYTRVGVRRLRVSMSVSLVAVLALATLAAGFGVKSEVATAAPANTINFQARLQTASGAIAGDGFYNVRFKLYNAASGGTALWTETYLVSASDGIRVANGYLTSNLGSVTAFPGSINWGQQLYLTMEVGGTGSSPSWDGEMSPRLAMTSVPSAFALNSYNSANGFTSSLSILQPTGGNQIFQIPNQNAAGTYNVCIANSTSCGFAASDGSNANYIQNRNSSAQTNSNFWISGTGRAATALQAPSFDSLAAGNLNIGTTNATSITLGKVGVNTIVAGNLSVGTTSSYGAITIANGAWLTALDSAGTGSINMLSVNSNNEIQVGAALNVDGGIVLPTDGGQMTFSDLPISSSAVAGTAQSYTLRVGSSNALTVYGEADGAGNAQNIRVAIGSSITPGYTLDVGGDARFTGRVIGANAVNSNEFATLSQVTGGSGNSNYIQNQNSAAQSSANFWISGTGRAAGGLLAPTLDTITAGALGIGGTNATSITIGKVGVTTTVAGGLTVNGAASFSGTVQMTGDLQAGNQWTRGMTRTLPTVVGDAVDIGSFNVSSGARTLEVSITVSAGGFSVAKRYILPVHYNDTSGAWYVAHPIADSGAYAGNDYALDINSNNNVASLRIRRVAGTTAGTAAIAIVQQGSTSDAFTASSTTSTVLEPTNFFAGTSLTQTNNRVGIGTLNPGYPLDVQGGSINTSGGLYTGGNLRISSAGAGTLTTLSLSGVLTSTVTTGTAPFTVASTTKVTNLNADLLDGLDSSAFCQGSCVAGGSASGDLTGTYPNPTIAKLQGSTLTLNTPVGGNILLFNGTAWVNQAVTGDIGISSTGVVTITAGSIVNADLASGSFTNITGVGTLTGLTVNGSILPSGHLNGSQNLGGIGSYWGTTYTNDLQVYNSGGVGIDTSGSDLSIGAGKLFVQNSTGRVGIGTSSPASALDVAGSISTRYNNLRTYENVYSSYSATSSVTGTLKIVLPNSWTNTMLKFTISGYDYSANAAWTAVVSGYNYGPSTTWINNSAEIRGTPAPFNSIRLGYDTTLAKNVLLLGTTSSTWSYPQFSITEVTAGHSSQDVWGSGYSSAFVTSESDITNIASPTTQIAAYGQVFLQGGNSYTTNAILGTNDNFALTFETNNTARLTIDTSGNANLLTGGLQVGGTTVITSGRVLQNITYNGGTVGVGYGGTGVTSFTQYGILYGNNTGSLGVTGAGTNGQCMVATTGGAPAWGSCASVGSGVTLQAAYNNSLGGTTPEIVLDAAKGTLDVQAYSGQTADLLNLRAYSASGLGVSRFSVSAAGLVTAAGGLVVSSGGADITGGINNNGDGITNAGNVTGVTGITTTGGYTQSGATANVLTGATSINNTLSVQGSGTFGGNLITSGQSLQGTIVDASATNFVANGNFETNTTGWSGNAVTMTRTTDDAHFGNASMSLVYAGSGDGYAVYNLPTMPKTLADRSFTYSFWAKASIAGATTSASFLQPLGPSGTICSLGAISVTTSWQRYQTTCTVPSGTTNTTWRAVIRPLVNSSATLYIDGVNVQSGTSGTDYTPYATTEVGATIMDGLTVTGAGGSNVDMVVSGRLRVGADAAGNGGVFVDNTSTKFMGANGSNIGFYNGSWILNVSTSGASVTGTLGVSGVATVNSLTVTTAATIGGNLTVSGSTVQLSNFYPEYRWRFANSSTDTNWKKAADIALSAGSYKAASFQIDVTDANGNFGQSVDVLPMRFYASAYRSGATPDVPDNGSVSGPSTDYVRLVKSALGTYELQIRAPNTHRTVDFTIRQISGMGDTVTYVSGTPADGSTTGTIYTSVVTGYTARMPNANVAGALTVQGNISTVGVYQLNGVTAMEQSTNFLRINQSNQFSSGIWLGSSALRAAYGGMYLGSNGGDGQIALLTSGGDQTRRITLSGNTGTINITGTYQINGTNICTSTGCTPAAGSGSYIQNGTSPQTASFNITGGANVGTLSVDGNLIIDMPSNNPERGPFNPIWTGIGAGRPLYADEEFAVGNNSVSVYNNLANGSVTITRETGQTGAPNTTGVWLKVSYDGVSGASPNWGGVYQPIPAAANKTFAQRFRAKIPVGRSITLQENSQGTNNTSYWLTNTAGTGKWEDYIRISHAGNTGTFSSGGHLSISGGTGAFDWYISSMNVYEVNASILAGANTWTGTQTLSGAGNALVVNNSATFGANVGIGTTTPGQKLDVQGGNINTSGNLMSGGTTRISSTGAGTLTTLSLSGVLTSTVATGTAPLTVASTTKVTNLNADLLDGYDSSSFLQGISTVDDISVRVNSGLYQTSSATIAEGYPVDSNSWYHMMAVTHSNQSNYYSMQFSGSYYNSTDIFYRSTNGSGTTAWNRLWHSGNDGASTGLDADLLDGQDASAFAAASGSANYIQNGTSPQNADFNITGIGKVGGTLTVGTVGAQAPWTARSITASSWRAVTYGNGQFVAVAYASGANQVATSSDGVTWTPRTATNDTWTAVAYGNGKFVAVGDGGSDKVMTSSDGVTWSSAPGAAGSWKSVAYGNGIFVAVGNTSNFVMTSTNNGVTWTARTPAENNAWQSVTYGNGKFVAVASSGTNRVMTSPDGITWTAQTAAASSWKSVVYGGGQFVAVATAGTNRVMTSPDGITWTAQTAAAANSWNSVTYGGGQYMAVSSDGTNRVMLSADGVTWTAQAASEANAWQSVVYGNATFVAVSNTGTNRVMTRTLSPTVFQTEGSSVLNGNTAIKIQSTAALQIQDDNSYKLLTADTLNKGIGVGTAAPQTLLHVGVTPNAATYPATEVAGDYYCVEGDVLSGTTCTNTETYAATYNSGTYSCPSGGTLSGTTCTYTYSASYYSGGYYCPSGGSLSGTTCYTSYSASYQSPYYSCPNGGSLSGTTCTQAATPNYSCPNGYTPTGSPSGSSCYREFPQYTTQASCNAAGYSWTNQWQGCYTTIPGSISSYSCPSGWSVSGSNCTQSAQYNAGYYYCPSGGTLSGTSCNSSYGASYSSPYYYCPSGGSLSGTTCTYTYTATLTGAGYVCPDGGVLSGSTCYVYTTYPASPGTIYFVCTAPSTLSGEECIAPMVSALFEGRVSIGTDNNIPLQYTRPARVGSMSFNSRTDTTVGSTPYGIAYGDFDDDGDIDVATADYGPDYISILKNNGSGMLGVSSTHAVGSNVYDVIAADLDGDGDIDLATANQSAGNVSILTNNGTGNFTVTTGPSVGSTPRHIAAADLNGDGDIDLIVSNYSSNTVSILTNNGTGTFTVSSSPATGSSPRGIATLDLEGDGDIDLAIANYGANTVTLLVNNGSSTFTAGSTPAVGNAPYDIVAADIDGDDDMDLVTSNYNGSTASILKNGGTGGFTLSSSPSTGNSPAGIAAADFDNDGDIDLAFSGSSTTVTVFRNNGTGTFTLVFTLTSGSNPYDMVAPDMNGDGAPDLALVNSSSSSVSVFLNEGAVPVETVTYAATAGISAVDDNSIGIVIQGAGNQQAPLFVAQDANGNPSVAMNTIASGNSLLAVGKNAVNGSLNYSKSAVPAGTVQFASQTTVSNSTPYGVAIGDVDADGDLDTVSTGYSNNFIQVNKNGGTGTFTLFNTYATGSYAWDVVLADMDGDGDLDAVVTNYNAATISVLKNNGDGSFAAKSDFGVGSSPRQLAAADFDGDGDTDIAVGNYGTNTVSILKNNGTATSFTSATVTVGSSPWGVAIADFDGDGDKDVAVANASSNTVSVLTNNGTGTFAVTASPSTGNTPTQILAVDLDNDGKVDLVTANQSANTVSFFKGNGNATFMAKADSTSIGSVNTITAADFDGDGDKDLAAATTSTSYSYLVIMPNNGYGSFGSTPSISAQYGMFDIQAADLNADGKQDIATVSYQYYTVGYLLNSTVFATPKTTYVATLGVSTSSASSAGLIIQGSANQTGHLFVLQDSNGANLLTVDATGKLQAKGTITGGVASPDYAENIGVSDPSIEAADVVAMDPNRNEWAIKATAPYDSNVLGVISTSPGFLTNASSVDEASAADQRPLALSGRVPVKVSNMNGVIRQGDYLTSSTIPGVAMKATGPGAVIGVAMADFTGTESTSYICGGYTCGKVLMFINPSATNPAGQEMVMQGSSAVLSTLTVNGALHADSINTGGLLSSNSLKVHGNAEIGGYLKIGGDLTVAGTAQVGKLVVKKHIISDSEAPLVAKGSAAGQDGLVTIDGTDVAGTLNITVKARPQQGDTPAEVLNMGSLADVTFFRPYDFTPRIVVSPTNPASVKAPVYLVKTTNGWQLMISEAAVDGTVYQFDYVIVGSKGQPATSP